MGIYSITYLINSFGFATSEKTKKIINFIVICLLIFMSGTRYYMGGSDVIVYEVCIMLPQVLKLYCHICLLV